MYLEKRGRDFLSVSSFLSLFFSLIEEIIAGKQKTLSRKCFLAEEEEKHPRKTQKFNFSPPKKNYKKITGSDDENKSPKSVGEDEGKKTSTPRSNSKKKKQVTHTKKITGSCSKAESNSG